MHYFVYQTQVFFTYLKLCGSVLRRITVISALPSVSVNVILGILESRRYVNEPSSVPFTVKVISWLNSKYRMYSPSSLSSPLTADMIGAAFADKKKIILQGIVINQQIPC